MRSSPNQIVVKIDSALGGGEFKIQKTEFGLEAVGSLKAFVFKKEVRVVARTIEGEVRVEEDFGAWRSEHQYQPQPASIASSSLTEGFVSDYLNLVFQAFVSEFLVENNDAKSKERFSGSVFAGGKLYPVQLVWLETESKLVVTVGGSRETAINLVRSGNTWAGTAQVQKLFLDAKIHIEVTSS